MTIMDDLDSITYLKGLSPNMYIFQALVHFLQLASSLG